MENIDEKDVVEGRIYEVGYLLVPTLGDEQAPVKYSNLKELVSSLGGSIVSDEAPKMIDLAYQMVKVISNIRNKFDNAYFGWIKFSMSPEEVLKLKAKLDLDVDVIRFLMIKTVKENTLSTKKFMHRDTPYRKAPSATPLVKKEEESGEPVEINKEEIDKEIDAMVS